MHILISKNNNEFSVSFSDDLTWPDACQLLTSALRGLALKAIDSVTKANAAKNKLSKSKALELRRSVTEDVADNINYAISNILDEIAPKDPDLQLSEVAIATMENEIIHYAHDNHLTMKQALKEYEERLLKESKHVATPSVPKV